MKRIGCVLLACLWLFSCSHAGKTKDGPAPGPPANTGAAQWIEIHPFSGDLAAIDENGETGFINKKGKRVLDVSFQEARPFSEKLAAIRLVRQWGYINQKGRYVINPRFEAAGDFHEGLAAVKKDGLWGFIDTRGKTVIDFGFSRALDFSQGLAAVEKDGKWGFIDARGRFKIKAEYTDAGSFSENLAPVKEGASWAFIDRSGKTAIPAQFSEALSFSQGLAAVEEDTLWGYIDHHGRFVVNPAYDGARPFSDGLAAVKKGHHWGYISPKGGMVLQPDFFAAMDFSEGLALVNMGGLWAYIDPEGDKALDLVGHSVGGWTPPDVNVTVGPNSTITIYNLTSHTLEVSSDSNTGAFFALFNGLRIPPFTSLTRTEQPQKQDYAGNVYFAVKDDDDKILADFYLWLFTQSQKLYCESGMTLVPEDFGETHFKNMIDCSDGEGLAVKGVLLTGKDYRACLVANRTHTDCYGTDDKAPWDGCGSPLALIILPVDMNVPDPFNADGNFPPGGASRQPE